MPMLTYGHSVNEFKKKMSEWGYGKHLTAGNIEYMARMAASRRRHSKKDTVFRRQGVVIPMGVIYQKARGLDIDEYELFGMHFVNMMSLIF
jgi:hypothetical protein